MGLVGVIISSSAGCLSVALSLRAIRRNARRRKFHSWKRTTDLRLTKATGITSNIANGAQITTFIKTSTTELVRKRRAAIVQTHRGKPTVSSGSYGSPFSNSYGIHKITGKGYRLDVDEATVVNNLAQRQDENTSVFYQDAQTTSSPLKEFTVVGSSDSAQDDHSPHRNFLKSDLVDDGNMSNGSCSETESCSFADDEFLSEEEVPGTTRDEHSAETIDKIMELSHPCLKRAKKVSFQFENAVGEQRDLSNSRADHENPVAENVLAIENLLQAEDVEIILGSEVIPNETAENHSGSPARVLEVMDLRVLMGGSDASTPEYSGGNDSEQGIVFLEGNRDKTPAKARKPLFVSMEPLAEMQALDEALNLSPTFSSPEVKGCPITWAVDTSEPDPNTKYRDDRHSTSAAHLQKKYSQPSYPCSENEKENILGSQALSLGKLSRKARREVERPGMFRRSSYPSLRRFRFSDRIKVRPLLSSGRNSN